MIDSVEFVNVLKLFINEICQLSDSKIIKNYQILLNKINSSKKIAIEVQCTSFKEFIDANKSVLLTQPLALDRYTMSWYPMQSSITSSTANVKAAFDLDFLPAFVKAKQAQLEYLHHLILRAAAILYFDDPLAVEYAEMASKLQVEKVDMEKTIVKNMFDKIKEFDKSSLQLNELEDPAKFEQTMEKVMASKLPELMMNFRKPGIRWKVLFRYFIEELEAMANEYNIQDAQLNEFIKSLKDSDYEITSVAPKLFAFIKQANLKRYMTSSFSDEENLALENSIKTLSLDSKEEEVCKDGVCQIKF